VFLADPVRTDWAFKAAKTYREHVERNVGTAKLDLTMRTDTRGSPHALICTKNQASYEARVRQRAGDLETAAKLGG
jgi:hypothetical protein